MATMNNTTTSTLYVNVYDITRNYGGPEEGGWWYDCGEPLESHRVSSEPEALELQRQLKEKYPRTGKRFSVLGGDDYDVRIEDHFAEEFPASLPRYE